MKRYDAVVIGGGPAGLAAALYLCRAGLNVALTELLAPGGQLLKTAAIDNYPGYPKGIAGWELAETFAAHLQEYPLVRYTESVTRFEHEGGMNFLVVGKEQLESRAVIICSGAQPRKLGLADEARLTGKGVSYCALCDGNFFRGQEVAVVGGGNSALEESLYLSRLVARLYLIHRRETFRAAKVLQDKVGASDKIVPVLNHVITDLEGDQALESVVVEDVRTFEKKKLGVQGLFVFVGHAPYGDFLPEALSRDAAGFIITDSEMRTNLPGVFAAGDIRSKQCRQVVTAVGDGATAATAAFSYLEQLDA